MSQMTASTKFYSLKMKEGEPIDQFVSKFRSLRLKLAQNGTKLKEQEACIRFLAALPPSYSSFVTSQNVVLRMTQNMSLITGMDEDLLPTLTINELVGALMQEDASRAAAKGTGKIRALFASKGSGNGTKKPHAKQQLAYKGKQTGDTSAPKKRVKNCNWCGLPNHWERECHKKKSGEPKKVSMSEANTAVTRKDRTAPSVLVVCRVSHSRDDDDDVCFMVTESDDQKWYLDTRATAHIAFDKQSFTSYSKLTEKQKVVLGDNTSLDVVGIGVVKLPTMGKHH